MEEKIPDQTVPTSNNMSPTSTVAEKKRAKFNKILLLSTVFLLLILLAFMFDRLFILKQKTKNISTETTAKNDLPTPTTGKYSETLINQKYGYSIIYPYTLTTNLNSVNSTDVEFYTANAKPGGIDYPLIYIITVPDQQDYYASTNLSPYFTPDEVSNLYTETTGNTINLTPTYQPPLKYKKLANSTVDGSNAVVLENMSISSQSAKFLDNQLTVVRKNRFTYLIGINYDTPAELDKLKVVLSTFKFINLSNNPLYWNSQSTPLSTVKYPVTWFTFFDQNSQCLELSDLQSQDIPQKLSSGAHNLIQICVYLGHMSQNPFGADTKNYTVNGLTGATAMKPSKITNGLVEHIMLQSKSGNEYAEFINDSGSPEIFHQIVAAFKFNR